MAAVKALQQWCKIQCDGYRDVSITNMTTSFRDGLAFCALIHKHRPDLIDFDSLRKEDIYGNNHLAFSVAEEQLGIPALLDAEDMVALKVPDRLSILTYVSQYYNYFHGKSPIGGMAGIKRPAESSNDQPSGKKNQPIAVNARSPAAPATENRPITAKTYTPGVSPAQNRPNTARTNIPATSATASQREVLSERTNKTGTLSCNCCVCNKHVHLVQRHLVDGKLYHRNCFRCNECSTILLTGTYKPGLKPGTFICTTHNTLCPPANQSVQKAPSPKPSPQNPPTSNPRPWTSPSTNQSALSSKFTPASSKPMGLSWLVTKETPTPTPSPRQQTVTVTAVSPNTLDKANHDSKASPASFHKPTHSTPSSIPAPAPAAPLGNATSKIQQARQKFFESGTSSRTTEPLSGKADKVEPAGQSSRTEGSHSGTGTEKKGRVLLKVSEWKKDGEKEREVERVKENEKQGQAKEKEKEKAKSLIGRKLAEEKNTTTPPPDEGKSSVSSGRVRLKPLDVSLSTNATPDDQQSPAWMKKTNKDNKSVLTQFKENDSAPNSWRSMLKPVKDPKSKAPVTSGHTEAPRSKSPSHEWGDFSGKSSGPSSGTTPVAPASLGTPTSKDEGRVMAGNRKMPKTKETAQSPKGKPDYIPKEEILQELDEIERNVNELERKGVDLEKQLRQFEEESNEDLLQDELMVDWFNLIRQKQVYMRRESELVYIAKNQDLEEQQPSVEAELRRLMVKPEHLKTSYDRKREEELMEKLVEIVNDRNAIVDGLDEDRLREVEEDEQLNKMMESLDIKKDKDKKKSPKSKWFNWKSKKTVVS